MALCYEISRHHAPQAELDSRSLVDLIDHRQLLSRHCQEPFVLYFEFFQIYFALFLMRNLSNPSAPVALDFDLFHFGVENLHHELIRLILQALLIH